MMRGQGRGFINSAGLLILSVLPYLIFAVTSTPDSIVQDDAIDFVDEIMPIVKANCISCHSGREAKGGLDLSTPGGWIRGGDSGTLFEPGQPDNSHIIERLTTKDRDLLMPQNMPALPEKQIALFRNWIRQGANFQLRTFERDIKPLFVSRCSTCHQGENPASGLDLNSFESVLEVIEKGKPEDSILIRRLNGYDNLDRMPNGFKALEVSEIQMVSDWILHGALKGTAPKTHWAYRPVVKPIVPGVASEWVKNPIDAFVLSRLAYEGLRPSERASREKLLRRLTQDLTGLPPTIEDLDRFVASGETYEQAVDRLLASPHFGERMAIPWLDLARYADSNGYEKDNIRSIWKYRDWVIEAFNSNMPYDQFTIKQLAGDLLPDASIDDLVATGFHRNTMHNLEGGVDQDEAMYVVRADRADTTSTVWLGQTMACARCHDHKFDPISHEDYFRFYAFFANNRFSKVGDASISEQKYYEPSIKVPSPSQSNLLVEVKEKLTEAESRFRAYSSSGLVSEQLAWEAAARNPLTWRPVTVATEDVRIEINGNEIFAPGPSPDTMSYALSLIVPSGTRGLRISVIPDKARANGGAGRADSGNFIVSRLTLGGASVSHIAADYTQSGFSTVGVLDSDPDTGWAISGSVNRPHDLIIEFPQPVSGQIELSLHCESRRWAKHTLGRFSIAATSTNGAARFAIPETIQAILAKDVRSADESATLANHYAGVSVEGRDLLAEVTDLKAQVRQVEMSIPSTLVMEEGDGKPEAPIRHRGEFVSPKEVVSSRTPASFGKQAEGSRLDLARWIVSPANPLTARVQVNRLWEMVFGRGLVETSENFGTQGTPPSHPELLDWLAAQYIESGWDTKALLKLIVSSSTYQQSSFVSSDLLKKDPENILLARGSRMRLGAEFIRDQALSVSGLLEEKLGGAPVFPFQPEGVWNSPYSGEKWTPSQGGDATRRSIYTFWKRTAPYPSFMAFDATSREQCTVRRSRTNTPLQALATLNDPGLFKAAQEMGRRWMASPGTLEERVSNAFRSVTSRYPKAVEVKRLSDYFELTKTKSGEEAAWTMIANILLNLDEALTKE